MNSTTSGPDWRFALEVLDAEIVRQGYTRTQFAEAAGVHRTWSARMSRGDALGHDVMHRIEGALSLPRGFIEDVASCDPGLIEEFHPGLDPDLKRWIYRKLSARQQTS